MDNISSGRNFLKYGRTSFALPLSTFTDRSILMPSVPQSISITAADIYRAIDSPIDSTPFNTLFKRGDKVTIVFSDITRYTASELFLPVLVDRLYQNGVNNHDITLLCALGIHRKQTPDEHARLVGNDLSRQVKIVDHNAYDNRSICKLGITSSGTKIELNRLVVESDHTILTGSIRFHYFAGFGGGRKSLLPGVSSFNSCVDNHLLVLNQTSQGGRHPRARTAVLEGNPVHEDMVEAAGSVPSLFLLNTIISPDRSLLRTVAGDVHSAFMKGCKLFKEYYTVPIAKKADLVIVSCGGYPWDINFIQAHKTMEMAVEALNESGVLIVLAECTQGYGNPRFLDWFNNRTPESFENHLRTDYEINGQTAYATFLKAKAYHIILVSSLKKEEVERMSLIPAETMKEALRIAHQLTGPNPFTYIIPEGSFTLPTYL